MPTAASNLLRRPTAGFPVGYTSIAAGGQGGLDPQMDFGILRLGPADVTIGGGGGKETVLVLLRGAVEVRYGGETAMLRRGDVFDEPPTTLHVGPGCAVTARALAADAELAVARASNDREFAPRLFSADEVAPEYRGTGLVQNACLRNVRLIFDRQARPESNLVVGEVVNYPGRWSSYPPHHHDQPEIYHYRFTAPDGYGHAEIGDEVLKVRDGDTVNIPPGRDHAQVSAPGYGMYYLWIIRHLPGNPYTGFTFAPEHAWTLDSAQQGWRPRQPPAGLA